MSDTSWGVLKRVDRIPEEDGRIVLRAIVDFYDGNSPDLTFRTVLDSIPVTIIEKAAEV